MKANNKRRPRIKAGMVPAATFTTALVSPAALGGSGDLDTSFGDVGRLGPILDGPIWSLEPQTDGSILFGGGSPGFYYWGEWFGIGGFVGRLSESAVTDPALASTEFDGSQIVAVARQPDGHIVAVGREMVNSTVDTRLAVYRVAPDGTRDLSFGNNGEFRLNTQEYGTLHDATSVVLDPDGRIVVAGSRNDKLIVLRLLPDGTPDQSFATSGVFEGPDNLDHPAGRSGARTSLLRMSDGGYRVTTSAPEGCLVVALTIDGALDPSFGDGGIAPILTAAGPTTYCNSMDMQPNGRLLVAGIDDDRGFAVRLLADGNRDSTFNAAAVSNTMSRATAVAADGNTAVVVAGVSDDGTAMMRLTGTGNVDATFGDGGIATFDLQTDGSLLPVVNDLSVGADRNIVGAGGVCRPEDCWWADQGFVVRLLGDGGESPGVIGFKDLDGVWAEEMDGEAVVNVRRTGGRAGSVGVTWQTVGVQDGALPGQDYVAASGSLQWADGDIRTQQIRIPILADNIIEVPELFNIVIGSQQDGAGLGKRRASVIIAADGAPHGQFGIPYDIDASEFYPASIPVFRDYYSSGTVSVTVTPVSGTAAAGADFVADPVVLTWADGETGWKEAIIPIVSDNQPEAAERFTVQLSNATGGAVIGSSSSATVTILGNQRGRVIEGSGGSGAFGWLSLLALVMLRLLRRSRRQS